MGWIDGDDEGHILGCLDGCVVGRELGDVIGWELAGRELVGQELGIEVGMLIPPGSSDG
jgi:hypothetical protein